MNHDSTTSGRSGLTLIEVLVALAILGIVAASIFAGFASIVQLNRASTTEVDFSRVVRSTMERIRLDWSLPNVWVAETVAGVDVDTFVRDRSGDRCTAVVVPDSAGSEVKIVRITCESETVAQQVFELEFGRP